MKKELEQVHDALRDLIETADEGPKANCSCHISPPCNNCIERSNAENIIKEGKYALDTIKELIAQVRQLKDIIQRLEL